MELDQTGIVLVSLVVTNIGAIVVAVGKGLVWITSLRKDVDDATKSVERLDEHLGKRLDSIEAEIRRQKPKQSHRKR